MSSTDKAALLASLRDIHEPLAPEPGWPWLLVTIVLGVVLLVTLWLYRPRKKASLTTQQINAARAEPPTQALVRLARLLRSNAQGDNAASSIQVQGDAWLQTLDARFNTSFFTADIGRIFGNDLYQKPSSDFDIATLCDQLQQLFDANQSKASA